MNPSQILALVTVIITVLLGLLLPTRSESADAPAPNLPIATLSTVTRGVDGHVMVNNLSLGETLDQILLSQPFFPEEGKEVVVESGQVRTMYDYQDAQYMFYGGRLDEIRMKQTPEYIHAGSHLYQAKALYGEATKAFKTRSGNHYVLLRDSHEDSAVWVFGYDPNTQVITSLSFADASSYYNVRP